MNAGVIYAPVGVGLFCLGFYSLLVHAHLLRKILAINIMGSGIFLVLVALSKHTAGIDPIPHAMVITGIVIAVSATALALALMLKLTEATGQVDLPDDSKN